MSLPGKNERKTFSQLTKMGRRRLGQLPFYGDIVSVVMFEFIIRCVPKKLDHQTHDGNFVKS